MAVTKSRGIELRPKRPWTTAELQKLRKLYPNRPTADLVPLLGHSLSSVYQKAILLGLRKSAKYLASPEAGRMLPGSQRGAACRFPKGHVPANKGLRRPGWAPGRMKETQFKKGCRAGAANNNWRPIGTELVNADGYLVRKVSEVGLQRHKWLAVHLLLWESVHGPVPTGHAVVFKNGDKTDIRIENLELLTRRELMARNTVHNLPKALVQVVQLRGALVRQINRRTKKGAAT